MEQQLVELVLWEDVRRDCKYPKEDNNDGYIYGLNLIDKDLVKSAHDVSLGGVITAISKMCIQGNKGIKLKTPKNLINKIEYLFAEDQGRYIIEINPKDLKEVSKILNKDSVHYEELGIIIDSEIIINEKTKVTIDELKSYNINWLYKYMDS